MLENLLGGLAILGVIVVLGYIPWLCTFGTAKYRRWAKENKNI